MKSRTLIVVIIAAGALAAVANDHQILSLAPVAPALLIARTCQ